MIKNQAKQMYKKTIVKLRGEVDISDRSIRPTDMGHFLGSAQ